jgi:UDP-N-acetylmuramyl pentapeptide phosphotransferase/UDP-N-acetylglucosamine-1-phosphate transferase
MRFDPFIVMAVALAVSAALGPVVIAAGIADAPDSARKAHTKITPTSGGLAIAAGFALALAVACLAPGLRWKDELTSEMLIRVSLSALLAFGALVLGLLDDVRPLGAKIKFGLIGVMSLAAALIIARAETLPLIGDVNVQLGFTLGVLGSALWMFTIVNAVNFMDGANGLAMGQIAIGLIGLALIAQPNGAPDAAMLALAGAGGAIGFLVWNFPSGKMFAGDTGALFVGALAGCAGLVAIQGGGLSPFLLPILFFPILADVLLTLAWRLSAGRRLLASHRDHLYQVGLRAKMGHARVSVLYWLLSAFCALIAYAANALQQMAPDLEGAAGIAASGAPLIAWALLAAGSVLISMRVRKFARERGVDGE